MRSLIKKSERALFDKMNGKPEKPPSSGFFVFLDEYRGDETIDKLSQKERTAICKNLYKSLPEETKNQYTIKARQLNEQYLVDVQDYCKKLSEPDMMDFLLKNTNSVNKKFLLTKLMTKDSGEDKVSAFEAANATEEADDSE
jgi:upstream-binding transcription factor